MNWSAKWIWKKQRNYVAYNQTILARKTFTVGSVEGAKIRITADSTYRLYVNGEWVNDGPGRSWPEHFKYDEIDVASYVRKGDNEIREEKVVSPSIHEFMDSTVSLFFGKRRGAL